MNGKHYKLRFLPLFEDYAVQEAIRERTTCAEAFETYHSAKERQYPYYRIYVKNYVIFYVVIGDVMEVRRILYNRRNIPEHI